MFIFFLMCVLLGEWKNKKFFNLIEKKKKEKIENIVCRNLLTDSYYLKKKIIILKKIAVNIKKKK